MSASRQNPTFALKLVLKPAGSVKGVDYKRTWKPKGLTVFAPGKSSKSNNSIGKPELLKVSSEKQVASPLIKSRNHERKSNVDASAAGNCRRRRGTVIDLRAEKSRHTLSLSPIERKSVGHAVYPDDTLLTLIADINF